MQVTTKTHTITTKTHVAVFTADEIKNVALLTAKGKAGVTADVTSSNATVGDDGSITVEIVETITADVEADAPADAAAPVSVAAPAAPTSAAPSVGLQFPKT